MLISLLMTLASFMGLFMIHYHNTTVYQPQLLLTAPIAKSKAIPSQPILEFYLEPLLTEDDVIDLDNNSYDDYELLQEQEQEQEKEQDQLLVIVEQPYNNETSPVLASIPFLCVTLYITALLCVQRKVLVDNSEEFKPKPRKRRSVINQ